MLTFFEAVFVLLFRVFEFVFTLAGALCVLVATIFTALLTALGCVGVLVVLAPFFLLLFVFIL